MSDTARPGPTATLATISERVQHTLTGSSPCYSLINSITDSHIRNGWGSDKAPHDTCKNMSDHQTFVTYRVVTRCLLI